MAKQRPEPPSPFLQDPRDLMARSIARAVESPIEAVRAINIAAAIHQAEIAKASGLPLTRPTPKRDR